MIENGKQELFSYEVQLVWMFAAYNFVRVINFNSSVEEAQPLMYFHFQLNKPPTILDSKLDTNHCSRYNAHAHQTSGRERTAATDMSMHTAPDSSLPVDLNMRKYLEELYKDKQYFDKYVKTESKY